MTLGRSVRALALAGAVLASFVVAGSTARAATNVTTAAYGNLRDDWDSSEPALSPASVKSGSFGELYSTAVEGSVYAQPLAYEGNVIVSTEKADAYAINAATGAIAWKRSFGTPFVAAPLRCTDLTPNLGSTSTPVIDPSTGTVYITTRLFVGRKILKDSEWFLQAISAATGEERPGFPVRISGTPYNSVEPAIPFNEHYEQQRPGLLLLGGVVYIAFASDCDITPYRGIVVGVNASSGAITTMWSDESGIGNGESSQSGIWQGGGGLVSNEGNRIVLTTGNGVSPTAAPSGSPPPTLSESVVGLDVEPSGRIAPTQFFSPGNAAEMDASDEDLGSGGPIALPTEFFGTKSIPQLIVEVGKDGRIFLLNAGDMGGFRQGAGEGDAVLQTLGPFDGVWGHPAAYGGQGGWVYILESAGGGFLRAVSYGLDGKGEPALTSAATSNESFGYTSGSPLVTSSGTTAGSAVVWVVYVSGPSGRSAQLRAYSAIPEEGQLKLLWSGKLGIAVKFATPTAYEGRVYVGTRDGHVIAFGPSGAAPIQAAPASLGSVPVGSSAASTVTVAATRNATVSAPIGVEGVQGAAGPAGARNAGASTRRGGLTAGPKKLLASGTSPLAHGVITVEGPPPGAAIAAGAPLRVLVRFRPRHAGPVMAILTIHTSIGTRTVSVSGYGTRPGLVTSAQPLRFGVVRTGAGGRTLALTFSNSWSREERVTGFRLPGAPFRTFGLPAVGTMLAPQTSVTATVSFVPSRAGSFHSSLTIETDHGSVTLPVDGTARTGRAHVTLTPPRLDFGNVPVGQTRRLRFLLGDGGNIPLTVTRAIGPSEPFAASVPLSEGITIERGFFAAVIVSFHPTHKGRATGAYLINSNEGRGYVRLGLVGDGV